METGPCYEATPQLVLHSDDNLTLIPWGTGAPSERYTHIAGSIDRSDVIIFCQNTVGQKSIKRKGLSESIHSIVIFPFLLGLIVSSS